ncbi:hypothetical protein BDZ94DRAFT_1310973 [Collybia nuda]|uniref:Uncharacterized protein n=1 Tax=Collybia nuda TaxID=64659 RepID=A0A9P6CCS5_9AGAR|nr:hypothetical protein BDZ94DRAFT_1310973 [Collybia nuda]
MDTVESVTIELLNALPKLKRIILSPPFTLEMADYCVQSDALRSFSCRKHRNASPRPMFTNPDSFQSHTNCASHSLSSLFVTLPFRDAVKFIRRLTTPEKIKEFGITSILPETRNSFATLVTTVAEVFTGLRTLGLYSPPGLRSGTKEGIDIRVLAPLLHHSELHHLDIAHGEPLDLQYQDLEDMALAWPSIKTLNLNPMPASCSPSSLTLEALQPFARHSHDLRHLGLYLDTTNSSMDSLRDCPRFQNLGALAVAMSAIQETSLIAMILSRIFPADCHLSHFRPVDVRFMPKEYGNVFLSRVKQWAEVVRLLPFFIQARLEERMTIN